MKVLRSSELGYCHGVSNTIEKAEECLKKAKELGLHAYSIGQLIHNPDTVRHFEESGLAVIEGPSGHDAGVALVRAHGIETSLRDSFLESRFILVDSTCHNIEHTVDVIKTATADGRLVIVLGKKGHAETICLMGSSPNCRLASSLEDVMALTSEIDEKTPITVVTQTTFDEQLFSESRKILSSSFSDIRFGNGLCPVCGRRKSLAIELSSKCNAMVVVGSPSSENTRGLAKVLETCGKPVYLVENASSLSEETIGALSKLDCVGICSGTSTPQYIIDGVVAKLEAI